MLKYYEFLKSGCDRVYLINCEVDRRVMCGFAFFDAHTSQEVALFDENNAMAASIVIPQEFVMRSQPLTLSSPNDNLEFQLLK